MNDKIEDETMGNGTLEGKNILGWLRKAGKHGLSFSEMQERCELTPTEFEAQYREPLETLRGLRVLRFDCAEPDNPRVYIKTVKRGRAPDYSTS